MTQETRDRDVDAAQPSDSRMAELEAALRERTKEQKLGARQLQLAESRLEQVKRERDDLLHQISELEADLETPRSADPFGAELERLREEGARLRTELDVARTVARDRARETEELRERLRSFEGRDAERQNLLSQVAALEEELRLLRQQNRDLEGLVLDANTEVQRSRKRADELWQRVTGGHPSMEPEDPRGEEGTEREGSGRVPSNDDSPEQEGAQIRGGDLSQLVDGTGELEPTRGRPPFEETGEGFVDPREMMKDTAELVGDDPIEVPEELREIALAEQRRRESTRREEVPTAAREIEAPDPNRLMAILGGEGTVDGDAPWESERGNPRAGDPDPVSGPIDPGPATGTIETLGKKPIDRETSEQVASFVADSDTESSGESLTKPSAEDSGIDEILVEESPDEEPTRELYSEEDVTPPEDDSAPPEVDATPPPVELPLIAAVASDPEPIEEEIVLELEDEAPVHAQTIGIEDLDRQDEFQRLLLEGARFHRTDRFGKVDLVNRIDIQISDWLAKADDLDGINEVSGGRMAEARLLEVLWVFFQRRMFRLEEA